MKSDEAIKTDLYKMIMGSDLQLSINGVVKKTRRPHRSTKEDIVISVLVNDISQIQTISANVNIFVPDKVVNGQPEEDTIRCRELSQLAYNLFKVFYTDEYRGELISQRVMENDTSEENPEHFINNKLEIKINNE